MGDEIQHSRFDDSDFIAYKRHLQAETKTLEQWFTQGQLSQQAPVAGFEMEAWLVDSDFSPAAINEEFLSVLNDPFATTELASFNIELNTPPLDLSGHVFSKFHHALDTIVDKCTDTASTMSSYMLMTGILPTIVNEDLTLANMSMMRRYRALNREVLHRRKGKPLTLDINGVEHLKVTHRDVMLESAATSFQLHYQCTPENAHRAYNASMITSAPLVALSANSPFLFGKDLWDETRIPLFEQAVAVGGYDGAAFGPISRVTFGSSYVKNSLLECFIENLEHYPVLLPETFDPEDKTLPYVRLHNGTIWRWNRPLLGFDETGQAHVRIEQRVIPAGPSTADSIANAAFYYGLLTALMNSPVANKSMESIEQKMEFFCIRDNFYHAAKFGLKSHLKWLDGKSYLASDLLKTILLPMAMQGLEELGIASTDRDEYLGIISERINSGVNGAVWQRAYVNKHGGNMRELAKAYYEQQQTKLAVHEWTV